MKFANLFLNKVNIFLFLSIFGLSSCTNWTNPTYDYIESDQISYDENGKQTAGVLQIIDDNTILVTEHFVNRYNSLISIYGEQFVPVVKKNDGVKESLIKIDGYDKLYTIDRIHFYYMQLMVSAQRQKLDKVNLNK